MASTTTFLQATNSVLRSIRSAEVASGDFADPTGTQNAKEIRQAKEILLDCLQEMQDKRPDSFWHTETDFEFGDDIYEEGKVIEIASDPIQSRVHGGINPGETVNWTNNLPPPPDNHKMFGPVGVPTTFNNLRFRLRGGTFSSGTTSPGWNFWRKIAQIIGPTPLTLEPPLEDAWDFTNGLFDYTIQRYRKEVPANFVDSLNVFYEGSGVTVGKNVLSDLIPVSPEELVEHEMQSIDSTQMATRPREYAIERDGGDTFLRVFPMPRELKIDASGNTIIVPIRLTMRYVRKQTAPSAHGDTFDMPEDEIPRLLNRAKHRANIEIAGNFDRASFYIRREDEAMVDAATKKAERVGGMRLVPDQVDSYRGHFRLGSFLDKYDARRSRRRLFLRD